MDSMVEKIRENIALSSEKPLFADEVMVLRTVKQPPAGSKGEREGYLSFVFVDMTNQKPISKIVVSPSTAKAFAGIIVKELEALRQDLKGKGKKKVEPKGSHSDHTGYIG